MYSLLESGKPTPISKSSMLLDLVGTVRAGFPSPVEEIGSKRIDLTAELITHPQATFILMVSGDSMKEAGILDRDIIVVNRALRPRHQDVVVAVIDHGDFTVKYFHKQGGRVSLRAANSTFPEIVPKDGQTLQIWGVVTASITRFRW